ncbi:flagellar biosynthetic protein FliR [Variovorax sp. OK605]|nr:MULTISPECIES: flagellar biosynthetic protein FliR [unclassified Variovorax]SEK16933.1 flagellar biosynthetic protein FliR [Variovorax sp. OK202]SFE64807.1 flagellar biosynthetic protein FliR [Variovorax sp. OK212]SFQ20788.1 flagellar biosynthetic protein FliR [Variovorax sp. OK605]
MVAFLWPFVRMLALISTAPIFSEAWVPRPVKVAMAAMLTFVIAPTLGPFPEVPVVSAGGAWIIVQQVLIGAAMGFSMKLVFAAVLAAGEYIGLQMGLSFASFFDPMSHGSTMVVARLLNMLATLIFLSLDGHLLMVNALTESFQTLPIATAPLASGGWMFLVLTGGEIFSSGLMLALPLITALLTLNLAMGILNRASPQFSIFAVGFPLTLLAGIFMLQLLMPNLAAFLEPRFAESISNMLRFTQGLRS